MAPHSITSLPVELTQLVFQCYYNSIIKTSRISSHYNTQYYRRMLTDLKLMLNVSSVCREWRRVALSLMYKAAILVVEDLSVSARYYLPGYSHLLTNKDGLSIDTNIDLIDALGQNSMVKNVIICVVGEVIVPVQLHSMLRDRGYDSVVWGNASSVLLDFDGFALNRSWNENDFKTEAVREFNECIGSMAPNLTSVKYKCSKADRIFSWCPLDPLVGQRAKSLRSLSLDCRSSLSPKVALQIQSLSFLAIGNNSKDKSNSLRLHGSLADTLVSLDLTRVNVLYLRDVFGCEEPSKEMPLGFRSLRTLTLRSSYSESTTSEGNNVMADNEAVLWKNIKLDKLRELHVYSYVGNVCELVSALPQTNISTIVLDSCTYRRPGFLRKFTKIENATLTNAKTAVGGRAIGEGTTLRRARPNRAPNSVVFFELSIWQLRPGTSSSISTIMLPFSQSLHTLRISSRPTTHTNEQFPQLNQLPNLSKLHLENFSMTKKFGTIESIIADTVASNKCIVPVSTSVRSIIVQFRKHARVDLDDDTMNEQMSISRGFVLLLARFPMLKVLKVGPVHYEMYIRKYVYGALQNKAFAALVPHLRNVKVIGIDEVSMS